MQVGCFVLLFDLLQFCICSQKNNNMAEAAETNVGDSNNMAEAAETNVGDRRWSLKGMTALVTGGTRGIGFVTSIHFHKGLLLLLN